MHDNYFIVPSPSAEKWFPDGNLDIVKDAVIAYITTRQNQFMPNGDVNLDNMEMGDLIFGAEELGLKDVPPELFVGIVPREVGTITRKTDGKPTEIRNSMIVGNAGEVSNLVLGAFRAYFDFEDANKPRKTPRQRAEERKRKRKKEK